MDRLLHMGTHSSRYDALLDGAPVSLSVRGVADSIGISPHVVRRLLTDGELHGVKIRHEWRIFRADLVEYLERVSNDRSDAADD